MFDFILRGEPFVSIRVNGAVPLAAHGEFEICQKSFFA